MRIPTPRGADHPRARFDNPEVEDIRKELGQGKPRGQIAKERGCAESTIRRIQRGESYRER